MSYPTVVDLNCGLCKQQVLTMQKNVWIEKDTTAGSVTLILNIYFFLFINDLLSIQLNCHCQISVVPFIMQSLHMTPACLFISPTSIPASTFCFRYYLTVRVKTPSKYCTCSIQDLGPGNGISWKTHPNYLSFPGKYNRETGSGRWTIAQIVFVSY